MSPDEVTWITENVAITNFFSAHSQEMLAEHQIQGILCLDRDLQGEPAGNRGVRAIEVVHLVDGRNDMATFRTAVAALEQLVRVHQRVAVHCRAGRSRSVAVVAAYLIQVQHLDADEALQLVMARRESSVAPELVQLVERFEV